MTDRSASDVLAADRRGGGTRRDDRVLPYTRVVAAIVLPLLAAAVVLLTLLPTRTDALFAWTILPPFTAMLLGSAYLGGIVYFVAVLRAERWHRVWTGMPAVLVFVTLACAATLLHLDRFHAGHVSFVTWFAAYLATPVLVLVLLAVNGPRDPWTGEPREVRVPRAIRLVLGVSGVAAIGVGVALFVAPAAVAPGWAWPVTPLTGRITGAILLLPGLVNVLLLVDGRWSAFRVIFRAQLVSTACILLAVLIRREDLAWDRPAAPLFVAAVLVALAGYTALLVGMGGRLRRLSAS